jgi:hypothetical protein
MKGFGASLLAVGVVIVIIALSLNTTVHTEVPSSVLSGLTLPSDVSNIGLLQRQMVWLHIGLTSFVSGAVLLAGGVVADSTMTNRPGPLPGLASDDAPSAAAPNDAELAADAPAAEAIPPADSPPDENFEKGLYWFAGIGLFILIVIVIAIMSQLDNKPTTAVDTSSSNYATDDALMGNDVTAVDANLGNAADISPPPPARTSPKPKAVLQQEPLDNDTDMDPEQTDANEVAGD